ncbi:hypothetical protein [Paracoccus tibetensis]|uniref:Uncharacterized protein n=1 Tax=Paracoccus tibetensis TaxID=336292 RepID=A0A1G5C5I7_9RHOB|nr:hypothetical protein [Paracoccus tibetensis]SCX97608.1 hypothetical protein SAMN05660710_00415 [Paracoccus tibetensis]
MFRASLLACVLPAAALAEPADLLRDVARIAAAERLWIAAAAGSDELDAHLEAELPLFRAHLAALDPAAASAAAANDISAAAAEAAAILRAASPADPAQREAGVIAALLLPEGGVAEAYEDGAEGAADDWSLAHHGLRRVRVLTDALLPELPEAERARAAASLERLEAAIPATAPAYAEMLPGGEIEFETQVMAAALLRGTGAPAWPGSDLARAARLVADWAAEGCADADPARGQETLAIAAFWHDEALSGTLTLFAPEALARAQAAFDAIADDGPHPDACNALAGALAEAQPMLGG